MRGSVESCSKDGSGDSAEGGCAVGEGEGVQTGEGEMGGTERGGRDDVGGGECVRQRDADGCGKQNCRWVGGGD